MYVAVKNKSATNVPRGFGKSKNTFTGLAAAVVLFHGFRGYQID
jgi:hypothetical protein